MKNILIIILSEISSGEITIGYEFGSRLNKDKYMVKFLVSKRHEKILYDKNLDYYTIDPANNPVSNKNKFINIISTYTPNYFILSDAFTMEYSKAWSGISLELIKSYNIPIIGVDEYEYLSAGYTPDYYGGKFSILPPLLNSCNYIIRNCPINNPFKICQHNIYNFSLYAQKFSISKEIRDSVYKKLRMSKYDKVVFIATSAWESINLHNSSSLRMLIKWIPIIIQNYLNSIGRNIILVHVGPEPWLFQSDHIKIINYKMLKSEEFDNILYASDLFLTTNAVSVTLTKAVYANVPCILFQNYKHINFKQLENVLKTMPDWYQRMANEVQEVFPFRVSSFGWYALLNNVLLNNKYKNCYLVLPLFNYSKSISKIKDLLYNNDSIDSIKVSQNLFLNSLLSNTDTPQKIMESIESDERNLRNER